MTSAELGVQLPSDTSASALLHTLLCKACEHFDDLKHVQLPESGKGFRKVFPEVLPVFEAARIASKNRSAIARRMGLEAASSLVYRTAEGEDRKLADVLGNDLREPLPLETKTGTASAGLSIEIPCDGRVFRGAQVRGLIDQLVKERALTRPAAQGLRWACDQQELDLRGRKIVLLGAGAELSPAPLLLAAGAEVLWIDLTDPTIDEADHRGTLHYAKGGADLLTQPQEILATIRAFAGADAVSVGMFAYAAGKGREWRLEASMNAIVNALPRGSVDAVGLYISPTSAACVHPDDADAGRGWKSEAPLWKKALSRTRALRPGYAEENGKAVSRAIVPLQGASYQAAQYIAKALAAEAFATTRRVEVVSANVAGITNTRSMSLPVFQAGFVGAPLFGIRIFETETTRWLSGLLLMHDWLNPEARSEDPAALFERQIHGGVYTTGHVLLDVIKVAAVYGFARKPSLIAAMARKA